MTQRHRAADSRVAHYLKTLGSNYALLIVNVVSYAISVPMLLAWLGSEQYGAWLILLQLVQMLSFVTMWIATPVVREAAACHATSANETARRLFHTVFLYYAACGTVFVVLTLPFAPIAAKVLQMPIGARTDFATGLIIVALYAAISMQLNLLLSLLTGFQQMHVANLILASLTVLATALDLAAAALGFGITGLAAAHLVAACAVWLTAFSATGAIRGIGLGIRDFDMPLLRRLLRNGVGYFYYCISYLLLQTDIPLIGVMLGPAASASYGVAYKIVDYGVQLIWKIPDSLLPTVAELHTRGLHDALRQAHRLTSKIAVAAALLGAIMVAGFGEPALVLWLGRGYAAPQMLFVALGGVLALQVVVHSSVIIPFGAGGMAPLARMAMLEAVAKVVLSIVLVTYLGMTGAALATTISLLTMTAWYAGLLACRITGDRWLAYFGAVLGPALPATLASATVAVLGWFWAAEIGVSVLAGAPLVVTLYCFTYLLTGLQRDERRRIFDGIHRLVRRESDVVA